MNPTQLPDRRPSPRTTKPNTPPATPTTPERNRFSRPESHSQRRNTRPKQSTPLKITAPSQQRERLSTLGIKPAEAPLPGPAAGRAAKGPRKAQQAFQRGLAALAQWVEREGHRSVPRGHSEQIVVDSGMEPVVVKLGVWVSNTRARRDKLSQEQLAALAELGLEWAAAAQAAG
ncbi:hypothetical protein GTY87_40015 [Streptomyces sp. SID7813]|nr:hypothetical protein [Streptomyces sp. SID7813]MYU47327.1 hypothetical protein [Streptomyces sp. SID7813]NSL84935.1 hypothetical protein [Streptomyces coelicolor]QFI47536.1 hypothetical protein FQ762_00045 [Streptomyces coelicolor A3(2)]QFI48145.1 hypothetical protein FQ762_40425 [Streptomyces coelicolor A3(2)]